jgi:tRNA/tmRNA/rRNA uracil-C5-methylase (TrmA/RlmC/RlmD family)
MRGTLDYLVPCGVPGLRRRGSKCRSCQFYPWTRKGVASRAATARCGGCAMQHFDPRARVAAKQRVIEGDLRHIGKLKPEQILPAIYGATWGYLRRVSVKSWEAHF